MNTFNEPSHPPSLAPTAAAVLYCRSCVPRLVCKIATPSCSAVPLFVFSLHLHLYFWLPSLARCLRGMEVTIFATRESSTGHFSRLPAKPPFIPIARLPLLIHNPTCAWPMCNCNAPLPTAALGQLGCQ